MQVNRACEQCSRRKTRCDGKEPCRRCAESSNECVYAAARKRGPKRKVVEENGKEGPISSRLQERLLDVCQAFVVVSWPIIYTPAISSLSVLRDIKPGLYSALLLCATATSPRGQQEQGEIESSKEALLHHFEAQLERQGGLCCSEPNLATIQALLFVTSYYVGAGKITVAWNHCGLACRMALSMSLHQSCRSSGRRQKDRMEEQEERRTFWGLYVMEQVVAYLLRLPPVLRAEDADRELPEVEERDEYELWLNHHSRSTVDATQARAMTGVRTHALSSFLAWVQVMKEHESIRKDLKRDLPSGTGAFERSYTERSRRLQAFKDELPAHLQWHSPFIDSKADYVRRSDFERGFDAAVESHGKVAPQILLTRAWYCECCILLHRPCVGEGEQGSRSARWCLCAATEVCAIVTGYEKMFGIDVMQSGFIHIIFQSATLLAAMESVYQLYGPDFWTPPLPLFPIGKLFDSCFTWLQRLSTRYPFANHYLSVLASLSRAQAQSWQKVGMDASMDAAPLPPLQSHAAVPLREVDPTSLPISTVQRAQASFDPSQSLPAPPAQLLDDLWDIAPFAGDNLNGWLSGIESFVPM